MSVPSTKVNRPSLRSLLEKALRTDADFDAFCLDYFPQSKKRFSQQMDRVAKTNLLLEAEDEETILQRLRTDVPAAEKLAESGVDFDQRVPPRQVLASRGTSEKTSGAVSGVRPRTTLLRDAVLTRRGMLRCACLLGGLALAIRGFAYRPQPAFWAPWLGGLGGILALVALGSLITVVRNRWRISAVSTTRFVGPQPMGEQDADRFFGRGDKIEEILKKLARPHVRHIVLFGESGCGKTSLLLAGLIPRLRERYECVYLRFTDNPVRSLRESLRVVGAEGSNPEEPQTLVEALQAARRRVSRPLLLAIDQFEEFHINPIGGEGYQAVLDLIWAVSGENAALDVRLILCLRQDFLHLFTDFYRDSGFARHEEKVTIEPFEEEVADDVIRQLLSREDGGLLWDAALVQRVLQDLVFQRITHGEHRRYVLPAELQIVFQMVQNRRIRRAEDYPGKKKLLLDYVSEAIATVPGADAPLVKQLLLSLIDGNGLTKAKPQTLEQLARQIQARDHDHLRQILDHLDRNRHVVRSFYPKASDDAVRNEGQLLYELAHDYLAGIIRIIAGAEMSGAKRSQALVETARLRSEHDPHYKMPITDCVQLWRYPAEHTTPEDLALIRRSLWSFGLRYCLPAALLFITGLGIRFGSYTMKWRYEQAPTELVLLRGIPELAPLLGASEPAVAMGFTLPSDWSTNPEFESLMERLNKGVWRPSALSFLNESWDPDHYFRKQMVSILIPLLMPESNKCGTAQNATRIGNLSSQVVRRGFVEYFLIFSNTRDQLAEYYKAEFSCKYKEYAALCLRAVLPSALCSAMMVDINDTGGVIQKIGISKNELEQLRKPVEVSLLSLETESQYFDNLFNIYLSLSQYNINHLASGIEPIVYDLNPAVRRLIIKHLKKSVINVSVAKEPSRADFMYIVNLTEKLQFLATSTSEPFGHLLEDDALAAQVRDLFLSMLAQQWGFVYQYKILYALIKFCGTDPIVIEFLLNQLKQDNQENIVLQGLSFNGLASLKPEHPIVVEFFSSALADMDVALHEFEPGTYRALPKKSIRSAMRFQSILMPALQSSEKYFDPKNLKIWTTSEGGRTIVANIEKMALDHSKYQVMIANAAMDVSGLRLIASPMFGGSEYLGPLITDWRYFNKFNMRDFVDKIVKSNQNLDRLGALLARSDFEDAEGVEDPLKGLLASDVSLRKVFETFLASPVEQPILECQRLAWSLDYSLNNDSIEERAKSSLLRCANTSLPRAFVKYRWLGPQSPTKGMSLQQTEDWLFQRLRSPESEISTAQRRLAVEGFKILIERQRRLLDKGKPWMAQFRSRLNSELLLSSTPVRYRILYRELLNLLQATES